MYQHLKAKDGFIYTDGKGHYVELVATDKPKKWNLVSKTDEQYLTYLANEEKRKARTKKEDK